MEDLKRITAVLYTVNGKEVAFESPSAEGETSVSWTLEGREGVTACYLSATCKEGIDGLKGIVLRPHIDGSEISAMAIRNHSEFWCIPNFYTALDQIPEEARLQSLLIKEGEKYRYYIPVCDSRYKTLIFGCDGGFEFRSFSNYDGLTECSRQLAFVCGEGDEPFELMRRCAKAVAVLLDNGLRMREERDMPEVFEYLGWCSWDALQIRVNHEGLLEKAREFKEKNVPVRFAIIDDMWADCPGLNEIPADASFKDMIKTMKQSKMRRFEGDPKRFPKGMKAAIEDLRAEGIDKIGVWFPTTGYWKGFTDDGEAEEMADLIQMSPRERLIVKPETEKAFAFFDRLCSKVRSWGGDFVKIDNQSFHRTNYANIKPIGESARAIQVAIDSATGSNFGGALINCMGMTSECMFNRRSSAVCRCSDDFMPESRDWFAKNILECAYNGTLQGQYYVNDWDMWWTDDDQARKNSLCRAISGGPVYVSDKLGRTDGELLKPLILEDGRILRPDNSAMPTADCLAVDPTKSGKIFKIQNRVGENGVAAVFNIDTENRSVSGTLGAADMGLADGEYAYYEYFTGEAGILREGESLTITLENNDVFRLYTFVPYKKGSVSVLGRLDKFIGIKAVERLTKRGVSLLEGGIVGFISETLITVESDDGAVSVERNGMLTVACTDSKVKELYYTSSNT